MNKRVKIVKYAVREMKRRYTRLDVFQGFRRVNKIPPQTVAPNFEETLLGNGNLAGLVTHYIGGSVAPRTWEREESFLLSTPGFILQEIMRTLSTLSSPEP